MATNDFLPFCGTDTGTNLESQAAYSADPARAIGNQPGIASSKFNNKALRQGTFVASQLAQYVTNQTGVNVVDDGVTTNFLYQLTSALQPLPAIYTSYASGSGTFNLSYVFFINSGSATAGATYTNNAVTYTVSATIASATQVTMTGNGAPTLSGTLTKASGTGDATLTFLAVRAPKKVIAELVGAGGGGGGGGTTGGTAGAGGNTTFGGLSAGGGNGGSLGGAPATGGSTSVSGATALFNVFGGVGQGAQNAGQGGQGGSSFFGGNGGGGQGSTNGVAAAANSGSGGGGAGSPLGQTPGSGGGTGSYIKAKMTTPGSVSYSVGAKGSGGVGSASSGGDGADGYILVTQEY